MRIPPGILEIILLELESNFISFAPRPGMEPHGSTLGQLRLEVRQEKRASHVDSALHSSEIPWFSFGLMDGMNTVVPARFV